MRSMRCSVRAAWAGTSTGHRSLGPLLQPPLPLCSLGKALHAGLQALQRLAVRELRGQGPCRHLGGPRVVHHQPAQMGGQGVGRGAGVRSSHSHVAAPSAAWCTTRALLPAMHSPGTLCNPGLHSQLDVQGDTAPPAPILVHAHRRHKVVAHCAVVQLRICCRDECGAGGKGCHKAVAGVGVSRVHCCDQQVAWQGVQLQRRSTHTPCSRDTSTPPPVPRRRGRVRGGAAGIMWACTALGAAPQKCRKPPSEPWCLLHAQSDLVPPGC